MDALITQTDFIYPFNVITGNQDLIDELEQIIITSQKDYLRQLLGPVEYNRMENNITNAEWLRFINGHTYSKTVGENTINIVYPGIKPTLALLIFYDYQYYIQNEKIKNGVAALQMQEAVQQTPKYLIVDAFNKGVNTVISDSIYDPTVYNFLTEFEEDDYPDWVYEPFKKINTQGI